MLSVRIERAATEECTALQHDAVRLCCAFERFDKLGYVFAGDAAQFADLDAAELAGPDEVVHLVPANVQNLGYLLDGECLHAHLLGSWLRWSVGGSFRQSHGDISRCDWLQCVTSILCTCTVQMCAIRADPCEACTCTRSFALTERHLPELRHASTRPRVGRRARCRLALGGGNRPIADSSRSHS